MVSYALNRIGVVKIPRHKPPSRIRYEKSHPTVSLRLDRELKERLKEKLEGKSFADFVKEGLGAKKREVKILEEERIKIYNEGVEAGYIGGIKEVGIRIPCAVCGEPLVIRSRRKRELIQRLISNEGWCHPTCKFKEVDKRRRGNR